MPKSSIKVSLITSSTVQYAEQLAVQYFRCISSFLPVPSKTLVLYRAGVEWKAFGASYMRIPLAQTQYRETFQYLLMQRI